GIQVYQGAVSSVPIRAGASCHDVRIDVHGVHRVRDGDVKVVRKKLLDIGRVALGAVADDDLLGAYIRPTGAVVDLRDRPPQEVIAEVRTITVKGGFVSHL